MTIQDLLPVLAIFGIACFIVIIAQKTSARPSPLTLAPIDVTVFKVCSLCRGHGRSGLAVDPRNFTKYEDPKLSFEDFPVCPECRGSGKNLFLTISMGPLSSGGTLLPGTFTYPKQQPGDFPDVVGTGSPSEKSAPAPIPVETSSTPSSPSSTPSTTNTGRE